jgi:glc operon protein GlcG
MPLPHISRLLDVFQLRHVSRLLPCVLLTIAVTTPRALAQGAAQAQTSKPQTIDLATAKKMVAAAEQEALKANAKVGIAVVDSNGDLVFSERLDGASTRGVTSAQGKARAALLFGLPTKQVQDLIAAGKPVQATVTIPAADAAVLVINQGGLPILKDGKVIGGIGVGGSASSEDERFAQAGINAIVSGK